MKKLQWLLGIGLIMGATSNAANLGFIGAGARASGMGGAFIAVADDATSIFWNPAGLNHLLEPEVSFVGRLDSSSFKLPGVLSGATPDGLSAFQLNFTSAAYSFKAIGKRHVAVAVSFSNVFDLDQNNLKTDPTGSSVPSAGGQVRTQTVRGKISQIALGGAIDVAPGFYLGLGGYWHVGRQVNRDFTVTSSGGLVSETETSANINGGPLVGLGMLWDINAQWHAGALINVRLGAARVTSSVSSTLDYDLGLPASVGIGAAWTPSENWVVAADYRVIQWGGFEVNGVRPLHANGKAAYSDAAQLHLGLEYLFPDNPLTHNLFPLRFGFYSDPSGPVTDKGVATNATFLTFGFGLVTDFGEISFSMETGTRDYGLIPGTADRLEEPTTRVIGALIYRL